MPVWRSRTNTSSLPLVSPGTRLLASELKATKRPSAEIAGSKLSPLPWTPPGPRLTRWVVPVWRSRTNTSSTPLVSPGTRLVASESKATKRPSAEIAGPDAGTVALDAARADAHPLGRARLAVADEHVVTPLVSPGTRLLASDLKATNRPSAEIAAIERCRRCPGRRPARRSPARVVPVWRSRTNTSSAPLVSPGTRLVASDVEGDEAPVRRDRREAADVIALDAARPTLTVP